MGRDETTASDWQRLAAWNMGSITDREYADFLEAREFPRRPPFATQLVIDRLREESGRRTSLSRRASG